MDNETQDSGRNEMNRRQFVKSAATTATLFTIVPRHVLGGKGHVAANDKLNIATIGAGGMGRGNTERCSDENIVALCDVDSDRAKETFETYPDAVKYVDFREMLDKQKDIDAVIVATPDHTHAVAAMAAMQLGKHVYVQKPMTRTISEARALTEAAHRYKVITQMGNQGHSGEGIRLICEWIWDGAIGPVREVQAWTNRPVWAQGIARPTETPPVPSTLNWDLWLGTAPQRPYHPTYVPFSWRGWWDFGTASLGDMACHILDPVFWALKLGHADWVQATSTKRLENGKFVPCEDSFPQASVVHYRFPAREKMPPVELHWYDGGLLPARPAELDPDRELGQVGGVIFVGDSGKIICDCYALNPRIFPESAMKAYQRPPKTIPRVKLGLDGHEKDWIRGIKEGYQPSSNFDVAGPMTEAILLGCVAIRANKALTWDGPNMKVTNDDDANAFVHHNYRSGWSL